jgi:lysophospholipase L1-like esterase
MAELARRSWLGGRSELQKRLSTWAESRGLPFLDLTPVLRNATETITYPFDGHWNAAGHALAAEAMAEWIEREF